MHVSFASCSELKELNIFCIVPSFALMSLLLFLSVGGLMEETFQALNFQENAPQHQGLLLQPMHTRLWPALLALPSYGQGDNESIGGGAFRSATWAESDDYITYCLNWLF